jgi:hypothetical protein
MVLEAAVLCYDVAHHSIIVKPKRSVVEAEKSEYKANQRG